MTDFKGKVVWLIGASSGIGRETAKRLAREGATVVATARSADQLAELAGSLPNDCSGGIVAEPGDVTDCDGLMSIASRVEKAQGPIDLMIFSAAYWNQKGLEGLSDQAFRQTYEVNVFGALNAIEAVLERMIERGKGHIALISSVAGYRGLPNAAAYGSSKAALTNLAESIYSQAKMKGVQIQAVHPGFVETPMTDKNDFSMPFIISAEKAAERIVRGLKSRRFEITFPRRFTYQLKLLRILPYGLYFALTDRMVKQGN